MSKKFCIFHIEGGLGKHVAATAVARCIKSNHPDRELIVVCAYPEIFLNLDFISRVYKLGITPYFFETYIQDKDSLIFKHEPYFTTEHIVKRLPLIENWCKLYNLEYKGELPELKFNFRQQQIGYVKWLRQKPVLVIQTNGGPIIGQQFGYSWTRDLPFHIAQDIVNHFKNDYHIIQICRDKNQGIEGVSEVISEEMPNTELFYLLTMSNKRILIDSCLQHAAAALNLKSTVVWIGTSASIFGYSLHTNIQAKLPEKMLPDSYLFDYSFNGVTHECPIYDWNDVLTSQEIIYNTING